MMYLEEEGYLHGDLAGKIFKESITFRIEEYFLFKLETFFLPNPILLK